MRTAEESDKRDVSSGPPLEIYIILRPEIYISSQESWSRPHNDHISLDGRYLNPGGDRSSADLCKALIRLRYPSSLRILQVSIALVMSLLCRRFHTE
ncbi:uncharacterized protein LOC128190115 isoform X2 [Crassostrea angulata]|uniref:uncharacterized protein LOC128190115 isoform X2 n=1 Tax=Magallana angulata TaxID=2784310 RepID=UPI0022B1AA5A|nr:uncharacterized protein LOC128190115 isoform X2 [Crassostrea angulata]